MQAKADADAVAVIVETIRDHLGDLEEVIDEFNFKKKECEWMGAAEAAEEIADYHNRLQEVRNNVILELDKILATTKKMEKEKVTRTVQVQVQVQDDDVKDIKKSGAELGSRSRRRRLRYQRIKENLETKSQP